MKVKDKMKDIINNAILDNISKHDSSYLDSEHAENLSFEILKFAFNSIFDTSIMDTIDLVETLLDKDIIQ